MSSPIITVENLSKSYRLQHQARERYTALRDVLTDKVKGLFGNRKSEIGNGNTEEEFWALKDVSFEIKQGEVVGIIGRNGAGKSTLLKILSRITEPTSGRITLRGRVASLLEVGTGFHPELTGRENIFLNGAILGMTRAEVRSKFDEIVAFAEVEKFLDTPVKRYSSGMYVRLAFAVAAHLEPEILVVDEVLAVGDAAFQQKCLGKMKDVSQGQGRTVLFVSHNMGVVRDLCGRAIFLHDGRVTKDGPCQEVVSAYMQSTSGQQAQPQWRRTEEKGGTVAAVTELSLMSADGRHISELVMGDPVRLEMKIAFNADVAAPQFGVQVHAIDGMPILDLRTRHLGLELPRAMAGPLVLRADIAAFGLYPGDYYLSPWVTDSSGRDLDWVQYSLKFTVLPRTGPHGDMRLSFNWGKYYVPSHWRRCTA